jgi:Ni,Fe-hydrogenase III large subunit/Ni,Fe-hydrogenase III component G
MMTATNIGLSPAATLAASVPGATILPPDVAGQERVEVPLGRLPQACQTVSDRLGGVLSTMVGIDDRVRTDTFRLVYAFAVGAQWLSVEATVDPAVPAFPSTTPVLPATNWYEREVQDLLGLVPEGHPAPRRLVLHEGWPAGVFPLRKDFDSTVAVGSGNGPMEPMYRLRGDGIVEIPVGPIHAGVIEPGHFRFAAVGEVVLHLEARLFYTHRGVEKAAEGKSPERVLQIAERTCGVCACSHAVSYCQAVEALAGVTAPRRAATLRTVFLELERLYNHVGDVGNICAGVGLAVGSSQGARLKESLQRLNERLTGSRFLRGVCRPGGVRRDLDGAARRDLTTTLAVLEPDVRRFVELLETIDAFQERLCGTGVLAPDVARTLGAVGVAARASGIDRDARRDLPHAAYDRVSVPVAVERDGDVRARLRVRISETLASFELIRQLEAAMPDGPLSVPLGPLPPYRSALGVTESPRGENIHWVRTGPEGTIDRYRIRSASFCNWPVVPTTVPGNMVPDFPLINKSFELCYSCLDR